MNDVLKRFLIKLGIEDTTPYNECNFSECKFDKKNNILEAKIELPNILAYAEYKPILDGLEKLPYSTNLVFDYKKPLNETKLFELLRDEFKHTTNLDATNLPHVIYDRASNSINISFFGDVHERVFKPMLAMWEELLDDVSLTCTINTKCIQNSDELAKREQELKNLAPIITSTYNEVLNQSFSGETRRVKGNYQPIKLNDVDLSYENVSFVGQVFQSEQRTSKKNNWIVNLYVYDKTNSIEVLAFENRRNFKRENLEKYMKEGTVLKVRGHVSESKFTHELQVIADYLDIVDEKFEEEYTDDSEEKRVELHLHSKMSNMDGLATITDYCKQASKWGMKAIALTDHGVVQAFPEAQKAAKSFGIKMIYGSELYMVDEKLEYIMNPSSIELNKASYCVFDFETTGLSARYDKIIEFGAVKVRDGLIVDNIDLLIDPEMELSKTTTQLTHITTEMVRGKTKIKEAIEIMKKFIGDSILVSHNASFDVGFLNEAFLNNGYNEINNPVIDTLSLSRYLFPNNKIHTLGAVSRQLEVRYDETSAHRANYDAEVLNSVWMAMLARLTKNNFNLRHEELLDLSCADILKHQRPKHVTVYAKNKEGLKSLFKIISDSHIDYFASGPKVPRTLIEKYRSDLIVGSACFNGEVFDSALTRSKKVLQEKMAFYDFIEVQPLENYSFLVNDGQVSSMDDIKKIVTDLVSAADEINKVVVATGDAHYLHPEDKLYRDVYIFAKSVGGGRHPLNPYRRGDSHYENPDQHFRSTSEMLDCFAFLGEEKAKEIVVKNSNKIADMVEELYPIKDKLYPPFIENCDQRLVSRVMEKAKRLYGDPLPSKVQERLDAELSGIIKYGFSVQFFIASEIVRQANKDGFIVGSRGSVGSSFVATMADITEVNALPPHYLCPKCKYLEFVEDEKIKSGYDLKDKNCPKCGAKLKQDGQNLPFATFLGFKAEKVPDIDLNFSGDYQARAHELTKVLLGEKNVYRAGTIETVAEKTAYGYVLGYFEELGIDPSTIRGAEKTRIAKHCQDVKRTTGQHPGGIIVIPEGYEVYDFTAVQYPADDLQAAWKTTHFDFHAIHDNVLKLDLLGHVDPTALKMLGDLTGIDPTTVPMNDEAVDSIFSSRDALKCSSNYLNETTGAMGIPEFGTALTRTMLDEIKPKTFADLVLISGLSHGTDVWAGNAQDLLRNKVCGVEGIIACRDDVMLYLQAHGVENSIAFKTMEAVRKGKKIPPEYMDTLIEHKIPGYYIESANKCKYLFPKAHAIAYVTMAVRIAWYKVHQPLAYYATFFSTRCKQFDIFAMMEGKEAIIRRIEEIRDLKSRRAQSPKDDEIEKTLIVALEMAERGYKIGSIDLYKSDSKNFVIDHEKNELIPPFIVIDGLGLAAADSVIEARKQKFFSQEDLLSRTKLNSQNVENLKKLHVIDELPEFDQLSLF